MNSSKTAAKQSLVRLCLCLLSLGSTNSMLPAFAETLQTQQPLQPLQGQVTTTDTAPLELTEEQLNSFLGVWKVEIPKIRRKPTVTITSVSAKQVAGTYKGLLGTFPLWGSYQAETGEVRLFVDFSRSSLARMTRRSDKAIAQMTGKVDIAERTIIGSASLPEFSNRVYAFNGRKTN